METTAVYWEPKIRTYGFTLEKDLSMFVIEAGTGREGIDHIDIPNRTDENYNIPFRLVLCTLNEKNHLSLYVVFKINGPGPGIDYLKDFFTSKENTSILREKSVDLVTFQGPHFGDRYGIAYAVIDALGSHGKSLFLLSCSVSCVYLLVELGMGEKALDLLSAHFEVPHKKFRPSLNEPAL